MNDTDFTIIKDILDERKIKYTIVDDDLSGFAIRTDPQDFEGIVWFVFNKSDGDLTNLIGSDG